MTEQENQDEFTLEVVELEADNGASEEFVVLDRLEIDQQHYVLLASLSDVEKLQDASDDEWAERVEEGELMFILRVDGEDYMEPEEEEVARIQSHLSHIFEEE